MPYGFGLICRCRIGGVHLICRARLRRRALALEPAILLQRYKIVNCTISIWILTRRPYCLNFRIIKIIITQTIFILFCLYNSLQYQLILLQYVYHKHLINKETHTLVTSIAQDTSTEHTFLIVKNYFSFKYGKFV